MDEVIAALGDEQWHGIVLPWTGKAGLAALDVELDRRWGPMVQKESIVFTAFRGTHGERRNSARTATVTLSPAWARGKGSAGSVPLGGGLWRGCAGLS